MIIYISHESTLFNARSYFFPAVRHNRNIFNQTRDIEVIYSVNRSLIHVMNRIKGNNSSVIPVDDIDDADVELFRRVYRHISPNPVWFEMACFLRYFRSRSILRSTGKNSIVIADSDNLFFPKISLLNRLDFSFSYLNTGVPEVTDSPSSGQFVPQVSGGLMIFNRDDLDHFCHLILNYYQNEKLLNSLSSQLRPNQGICDMTFLSLISGKVRDLNKHLKPMDLEYDAAVGALNDIIDRRLDIGMRLVSVLDDRKISPMISNCITLNRKPFRTLINIQFNADSKSLLWGVSMLYSIYRNPNNNLVAPFLSVVSLLCDLSVFRSRIYRSISFYLSKIKSLISR